MADEGLELHVRALRKTLASSDPLTLLALPARPALRQSVPFAFLPQRLPADAEDRGGIGLIALHLVQHQRDVLPLEIFDRRTPLGCAEHRLRIIGVFDWQAGGVDTIAVRGDHGALEHV